MGYAIDFQGGGDGSSCVRDASWVPAIGLSLKVWRHISIGIGLWAHYFSFRRSDFESYFWKIIKKIQSNYKKITSCPGRRRRQPGRHEVNLLEFL